ncbi:MAG: medium chain dehydrogenase/reductase family protein [Bdellovibrionales bacterium]|nr:medium chain dehydrogenase/reductase family protein [Bdellovibrionales bacterium]
MKKIVIHSPGGHSHLKLETHPDLVPREEEVVVSTHAIGVNYADVCVRWGVYESAKKFVGWPITPGFEYSGIVKSVGHKVNTLKPGDRVFGISFFNAYASEVCAPEKHLFPIPEGFGFSESAAFPAVYMTAYHALFQLVRLPKNAKVLIHSAGGGVGSALIRLCRIAGFQATGVVGGTHKVHYVRELGATHVIDKSKEDWAARARKLVPEGFDAVLDANGTSTLKKSYELLRATGKLISYGSHSILPMSASGRMNYLKAAWGMIRMPRFSPVQLFTDNKSLIGFNLSFLFDRNDLISEGMDALLGWIKDGKIPPPKVTEFPFQEVGEAHRLIESGQSTGKIVLVNDVWANVRRHEEGIPG